MADLGFWNFARRDPDRVALVDPDGRERTRGELLTAANQIVHGLRALGLKTGDCLARAAQRRGDDRAVPGAIQIGLYLTPINHHLVGARDRLHRQRQRRQGVRRARALRRRQHRRGATSSTFPRSERFAVGNVEGFRPFAELTAGQPERAPEERIAGQAMHYTSGTTGSPRA